MACTHTAGCPLFPKLNASLRGWRDAYCDSEAGWHGCARFQQSRAGGTVPLTLLPNGKYAQAIVRTADTVGAGAPSRFTAAPARSTRLGEVPPVPEVRVTPSPAPPSPDPRPGTWVRFVAWLRGVE